MKLVFRVMGMTPIILTISNISTMKISEELIHKLMQNGITNIINILLVRIHMKGKIGLQFILVEVLQMMN